MRVSLAVTPLMLPIFSTDFSSRSSELSALNAASMSNAPGMTCASAKFGIVLSFWRIVPKLPLTFKRANASGLSLSALLELLVMLSKDMVVWVFVILGMLLIFSIVVKALVGSLVPSLITRSNLLVTGVQVSTLGMCSIWEMVCARSPLHLANMYPV